MQMNDSIIDNFLKNEGEKKELRQIVSGITQALKNWHNYRGEGEAKEGEGEEDDAATKATLVEIKKNVQENSKEERWKQKILKRRSFKERRETNNGWLIQVCKSVESSINPLFWMDKI